MLGLSVSVVPVSRGGIRVSAGVVPRYYGEDNGFELLERALEGRIVQVGPVTPFTSAGYGALMGETLGHDFRYLTAYAGLYVRLFGPLTLTYVLRKSSDRSRGAPFGNGAHTHSLGWQLQLHWRMISCGS